MLSQIKIQNFAIIEREEILLPQGFTVLSGETGAGKSIILDAITLILGGRASADMVRRGSKAAKVEAIFRLDDREFQVVTLRLQELGVSKKVVNYTSKHRHLKILREVSLNGKNRTKVNGYSFRVSGLKTLTDGLVEIVRQHESYTLLDPNEHLNLLDQYGTLEEQAKVLHTGFERWSKLQRESRRLKQSQAQRQTRSPNLCRFHRQTSRL